MSNMHKLLYLASCSLSLSLIRGETEGLEEREHLQGKMWIRERERGTANQGPDRNRQGE